MSWVSFSGEPECFGVSIRAPVFLETPIESNMFSLFGFALGVEGCMGGGSTVLYHTLRSMAIVT